MTLISLPNQSKKNSVWRRWGSEQWYWLQLDFADQKGRTYQITKDFESSSQELRLPNGAATKNRETIESTIEEVLGTASMIVLKSTLCVEQDALAEIANGQREIAQSLETIVTGGDEDIYTEQALKRLDKKIRDFRKGYARHATQPGLLAQTRDEKERLIKQVSEYQTKVESYNTDDRSLDKAAARLGELEHTLGPLHKTKEEADRLRNVQGELSTSKGVEKALEAKVVQLRSAQEEIEEADKGLKAFGSVALLSGREVREVDALASRIKTLEEEHSTYQKAIEFYKQDLGVHQEQEIAYEVRFTDYEAAVTEYQEAQEKHQEELEAYQSKIAEFEQDLAAYQEILRPYEEAVAAQTQESDRYKAQFDTYQDELAAFEEELEQYNLATAAQKKQWDNYERAFADYEQQLSAYDAQHEQHEKQREAYEEAQTAYKEQLAEFEEAEAALGAAEQHRTPAPIKNGRRWVILEAIGALLTVVGILVLALINNIALGAVLLVAGIALVVTGIWQKLQIGRAKQEREVREMDIVAPQRPEAPALDRPEPPSIERPKAPQRPELSILEQPRPPTPLEPLSTSSAQLQRPEIDRPERPPIEQPTPPQGKRPEPPTPPPSPPVKPAFDEKRLASAEVQLQAMLKKANCSTVADLNREYAEVLRLRNQKEAASSRLVGILGGSTAGQLEQKRREASRKRRDAEEILEEPELQRAVAMTPIAYNQLVDDIKSLEDERDTLEKEYQRLQIKLEHQLVSTEDLLQAEEALESAKAAYEQAQERIDVYEMTHDMLGKARAQTLKFAQESLGPKTAAYLDTLTNGRYRQVWIDSELRIELKDPAQSERRIQADRLSRGAQDQLYMAARLAFVDMLFPITKPPILLDDPFVHFDRQRLAAAIEMCCEIANEHQILLFTCSDNYNQVGNQIVMPSIS